MKTRLRHITWSLACLLALLLTTGCDSSDDLQEILYGKTWYITGASINGSSLTGDDIRELYATSNTYTIVFSSSTVQGVLAPGSSFSGKMTADGKKQTMQIQITSSSNVQATALSRNLFYVLQKITRYSGDANQLKLIQDNSNLIRLSSRKQ